MESIVAISTTGNYGMACVHGTAYSRQAGDIKELLYEDPDPKAALFTIFLTSVFEKRRLAGIQLQSTSFAAELVSSNRSGIKTREEIRVGNKGQAIGLPQSSSTKWDNNQVRVILDVQESGGRDIRGGLLHTGEVMYVLMISDIHFQIFSQHVFQNGGNLTVTFAGLQDGTPVILPPAGVAAGGRQITRPISLPEPTFIPPSSASAAQGIQIKEEPGSTLGMSGEEVVKEEVVTEPEVGSSSSSSSATPNISSVIHPNQLEQIIERKIQEALQNTLQKYLRERSPRRK